MSKDIIQNWSKYQDEFSFVKFILENGGVSRSRSEDDAKSIVRYYYLRNAKTTLAQRLLRALRRHNA